MLSPRPIFLLAAATFPGLSCDSRNSPDRSGASDAVETRSPSTTRIDSASAVDLLRRAIVTVAPDQLSVQYRVASYSTDSVGYHITLLPDEDNLAGGGGRATVTHSGIVLGLVLFQ